MWLMQLQSATKTLPGRSNTVVMSLFPSESASVLRRSSSANTLVTAIIAALTILVTSPRDAAGQGWKAHLAVGFASATFTGESDNSFTYRSAFAGGGGATLFVTESLGIRSELMYVIRGAFTEDATIDGQQTELDARFSIAYIDVPLLATFQLPLRGPVAPYAFGGVSYARNVDAQLTLISPSGEELTDSDSSIGANEFSLVAGLGLNLRVGSEQAFLEARFVDGLRNIRPERPDAPLENRTILVVAGMRF